MLTVDEANKDTVSAFEETDAAVDLRIKNSVCLVIDLEGFSVQKKLACSTLSVSGDDRKSERRTSGIR